MTKPLLVMFVGSPGSGKTTFARQLAERLGAVTINSDAIRVSMWGDIDAVRASHTDKNQRVYNNQLTFGAMDYAAGQIIKAGHSVVYDCNANRLEERTKMAGIATSMGGTPVVVRLQTPPDVAAVRISEREVAHDQNRHDIDKARDIVASFNLAIVEPDASENVVSISGEIEFDAQYEIFKNYLDNMKH